MTGKLEIYGGPTGELVYDSERGTDVTGYNEVVDQAYGEGVLLYLNPRAGTVHAYFNATRNAPEQFIGTYESNSQSGDLLPEFKTRLEDELGRVGWPLLRNAGGKQEFYNDLGNVSPTEPTPGIERIVEAVKHSNEATDLKFGVPDRQTAARFVEFVRLDGAADVVVTEAYIPDGYEDSDVKVYIGESESGVVPIRETREAVQQNSLRRTMEEARSSARSLVETAESVEVDVVSEAVVRSLEQAEIGSVGLSVDSAAVDDSEDPMLTWGVTTAVLSTVLVVLAIGYLSLPTLGTRLTTEYTVSVFYLDYVVGTFPSWLILAGPVVPVAGFGGWRYLSWLRTRLHSGEEDRLPDSLVGEALTLVDNLRSLQNEELVDSDTEFKRKTEQVFDRVGSVNIEPAASEQRETAIQTAAGAVGGVLVAALLGYALWIGRTRLFDQWVLVVDASLIVGQVLLVIVGLSGIYWVVRRVSRSPSPKASKRPSQTSGSAHDQSPSQTSGGQTTQQSKHHAQQIQKSSAQQTSKSQPQSQTTQNPQWPQKSSNHRKRQKKRQSGTNRNRGVVILLILIFILILIAVGILVYPQLSF